MKTKTGRGYVCFSPLAISSYSSAAEKAKKEKDIKQHFYSNPMSCFKTAIQICFCLISSTHSPSVDQLSGVEEFKNLDPARVCLCVWVCLSRTQMDDEIAFPAAASQTKPCRVLIAMI